MSAAIVQPIDHDASAAAARSARWRARLSLRFEARDDRTVLASRAHEGPLCVQRPFWPDADGTCHVYVLHPPGGIAGGDELSLEAELGRGSRALLTTPAATKIYRSSGAHAVQRSQITVQEGACAQWLPQETIVFDGARASLQTHIELTGSAECIAWELLCLGRPAAAERFSHGRLELSIDVRRDGRPILLERTRIDGEDPALAAAWGLCGQPILGTLLATAGDDATVDAIREQTPAHAEGRFTVSRLYGAIVCRYLGHRIEEAHALLRAALGVLRERATGHAGTIPRIWLT
jgi:urease accessory protein